MEPEITKYLVLDLETTGLDPDHERIIEMGAVVVDPNGIPAEEFQLMVNPGIPISPEASSVNGITDAMVAGCLDLETGFGQFLDFIDSVSADVAVIHNAVFDLGFIQAQAHRQGVPGRWRLDSVCSVALAKARIDSRFLRRHRLQDLVMHYRLGSDQYQKSGHRALYDSKILGLAWSRIISESPMIHTVSDLRKYASGFFPAEVVQTGAVPNRSRNRFPPDSRQRHDVPVW